MALIAGVLISALAFSTVVSEATDSAPVTAIDILLQPDATMLQRAEAANASHLKIFPQGFALDAAHRPHVTMVQRFVRPSDPRSS